MLLTSVGLYCCAPNVPTKQARQPSPTVIITKPTILKALKLSNLLGKFCLDKFYFKFVTRLEDLVHQRLLQQL